MRISSHRNKEERSLRKNREIEEKIQNELDLLEKEETMLLSLEEKEKNYLSKLKNTQNLQRETHEKFKSIYSQNVQ